MKNDKLPAKQEKKQYVTPKMLACYMLKLAGHSNAEVAKEVELTETTVSQYSTQTQAILNRSCPDIVQAKQWQLSILPTVVQHLNKRLFENDNLLAKYMEGIGVWTKNVDVTVKVIDLTTEELMGIIGEEAAKNPKIQQLSDRLISGDIDLQDCPVSEHPNEKCPVSEHIEVDYTVLEDQDDTNSNNAGTGTDSVPIPGQEQGRSTSVEEDSHGVDTDRHTAVNSDQPDRDSGYSVGANGTQAQRLKPLDGDPGTFNGVSQQSEGSAPQSSEGSRIPKENIGLSLSSKNTEEAPDTTIPRCGMPNIKYKEGFSLPSVSEVLSSQNISGDPLSTKTICSQCGRSFDSLACGPTHALVQHERSQINTTDGLHGGQDLPANETIQRITDQIQQACEPTESHEPVKRKRGRPMRRPYKWSKKGRPNKYNRRK